jgi:hypothetical protein
LTLVHYLGKLDYYLLSTQYMAKEPAVRPLDKPLLDKPKTEKAAPTPDLSTIWFSLLAFQAKDIEIVKDQTATVVGAKGTFKYKYASLPSVVSAVRKPLSEVGLVITQPINSDRITTIIYHPASGAEMRETMDIPKGSDGRMSNMQAFGSAITYLRRYMLIAMLGLAPDEDTDANDVEDAKPAADGDAKPKYAPMPVGDLVTHGDPSRLKRGDRLVINGKDYVFATGISSKSGRKWEALESTAGRIYSAGFDGHPVPEYNDLMDAWKAGTSQDLGVDPADVDAFDAGNKDIVDETLSF